jgi:hypothetical protein
MMKAMYGIKDMLYNYAAMLLRPFRAYARRPLQYIGLHPMMSYATPFGAWRLLIYHGAWSKLHEPDHNESKD